MPQPAPLLTRFPDIAPLRAGHFIVSLYGDAIDPRGGSLWMGNIIDICASVGISETLVRTAVSRLVAAEQLSGTRDGRRSFYELTETAKAEFARASRILFHPQQERGWQMIGTDQLPPTERQALLRMGFAPVSDGWMLGPTREELPADVKPVFSVHLDSGANEWRERAATLWNLPALGEAYRNWTGRFERMDATLAEAEVVSGVDALALRLLMVDHFRAIALRDPFLPADALGDDWPGLRARKTFVRLYQRLSSAAHAHIAATCRAKDGPLPQDTRETADRAAGLASF